MGNAQSHLIGMTMAFLTLSLCEIFHAFNIRGREKSVFSIKGHNKHLWGATALALVLTLGVIYIPGLNTVFQLTALSLRNLCDAFALAVFVIPIVEIVKACQRSVRKTS